MPTDGAGELERGPNHLADTALISRLASGDERAFETLVHTYTLSLVQFALGYVHAHDAAEEIVEDVFIRVWELRASWQPKSTVRAYLFAAVRNRAFDWLKHVAADQRLRDRWQQEVDADAIHREARQEGDTADDSEALLSLRAALEALTERQREVLRLRYEERLSYREVAAVLGISESAVDRLLSRAVQALRRAVRGGGWGNSG